MALSNLFGWCKRPEVSSACGSACGAGEKPEEKDERVFCISVAYYR